MDITQFLAVLLVLTAVVALVGAPLRRARHRDDDEHLAADLQALRAARDAKYREIREAELDLRTGKLSREDWAAVDGRLRREAMEILRRLDELGQAGEADEPSPAR